MKKVYTLEEVFEEIKVSLNEQNFKGKDVCGEVDSYKALGNMARFTLKDKNIKLDIILFKEALENLKIELVDGMQVICTGDLSVYSTESKYQLNCSYVEETGNSRYEHEFQKLCVKLEQEGIFETSKNKKVGSVPRSIGVVCKKESEGFKDIVAIWKERYPWVKLVHSECQIQGKNAARSILEAIKKLEKHQVDVILVARGGGDKIVALSPYNDEKLVRYIARMTIPVISGIGHETDYTLVDYVATLRGATPSHAAVLASIDREMFISRIITRMRNIQLSIYSHVNLISTKVYDNNVKDLKKSLLDNISLNKSNLKVQIKNLEKEVLQGCRRNKNEVAVGIQKMEGKFSRTLMTTKHALEKRNTLVAVSIKEQLNGYRGEMGRINIEKLNTKLLIDVGKYKDFTKKKFRRGYCEIRDSLNQYKKEILISRNTIDTYSINETLKRGYAIILNEEGQIITEVEQLVVTSRVHITMQDGKQKFYIQAI